MGKSVGKLLQGPGTPHQALAIPQVVADVAGDVVDREGLELGVVTVLVAVDGLEQADRAHLDEVLDGVGAPPGQSASDLPDQRKVLQHQGLTLLRGLGPLAGLLHAGPPKAGTGAPTASSPPKADPIRKGTNRGCFTFLRLLKGRSPGPLSSTARLPTAPSSG